MKQHQRATKNSHNVPLQKQEVEGDTFVDRGNFFARGKGALHIQ